MTTLPVVARISRPEYTGVNRCVPCTVLNVAIVAIVGAGLAALWLPVGVITVAAGLAAIWLRGYVVPGTPTLTRRYLPKRIARYLDAPHTESSTLQTPSEHTEADSPLTRLIEAGIITPVDDDARLTPAASDDWTAELELIRKSTDDSALVDRLATLLDVDPASVVIEPDSESTRVSVRVDDRLVGQWITHAALTADAAATALSRDRLQYWPHIAPSERGTLLVALRVFVPECPTCGGAVDFAIEDRGGCCWSQGAYVLTCTSTECGSAIYAVDKATADASIDALPQTDNPNHQ